MLAGILVDVSGSMRNSLQLHVESTDQNITRAQSIFSTIMNIVDREVNFQDNHDVFVLSFGLRDGTTCDLLNLLDYVQTLDLQIDGNGHENLIQLLKDHGAPSNADKFIRDRATEREAHGLFKFFGENPDELEKVLNQLNSLASEIGDDINGQENLIELLTNHGAPHADTYIRKYVTNADAQLLFKFYSENIGELREAVHQLPMVCKKRPTEVDENRQRMWDDETFEINSDDTFKTKMEKTFVKMMLNACEKTVKSYQTIADKTLSGIINSPLYMKQAGSFVNLCDDADTTEEKAVIKKLEHAMRPAVYHIMGEFNRTVERIKDVIHQKTLEILEAIKTPHIKSFQSTVNLLKQITTTSSGSQTTQRSLTSSQLSTLTAAIEPFIYGNTPMCEAIKSTLHVFNSSSHRHKVLFLLSDGESTDGNPVQFAPQLRDNNVLVFVCLLTSENIAHSQQLYYEPNPNWTPSQRQMFELSSTVENSHSAMSILLEQNWELPTSGHSRLFLQANHSDVIKEFTNVIQYITESNDVLLNMIGRVSLDRYINAAISTFEPKSQKGGTCYAHAVATVFHLAMRRIEGYENGVPDFADICQKLIKEYGLKGAVTETVLNKWAPKYRLHYKKVDELGARQAINRRRPVVATFRLDDKQWDALSEFYRNHPEGILETKDLGPSSVGTKTDGHAVVLMKCDPTSLTFINSWGPDFADKGFFRVRNQAVLNLQFYDVYWVLSDLKASEIQAFRTKSGDKGRELMQKLPPGIQNLPYQCPQCHECFPVSAFITGWMGAECPKCHHRFKPTPLGLTVDVCTH
jgi:hypothetical protein